MEVLAAQRTSFAPIAQPRLELIQGDGETTPAIGSLALASTSREDCMLADVDDLSRYRLPNGLSYAPDAVASISQNKVTAVKEGAIPYARSKVDHEWISSPEGRGGVIRDLGRTAVQTAMRGRLFYKHPESLARCDVEVEYAEYNQENLRPGTAHVIIAPKMTRKDGTLKVAKAEGLADTDSIQVNWLDLDEDNQPKQAMTEAILASDVPIEAWVSMLADPGGIFGKAIIVDDPESALSVMRTFKALEIPVDQLTEGPVSMLVAVLPYIKDPTAYQKVAKHIEQFRGNQQEMHEKAQSPAERWLKFDMATDQSLQTGVANTELQRFIESLGDNWGDKDRAIINSHKILTDGKITYHMTRQLAAVLQNAERNLILTAAAVVAGNEKVLAQMSPAVAERIYRGEMALRAAYHVGTEVQAINSTGNNNLNSLIASQNVKVGGGCLGDIQADFISSDGKDKKVDEFGNTLPTSADLSWHGGKIKMGNCVNCKKVTKVGVKNWCQQCISGHCGSKKAA